MSVKWRNGTVISRLQVTARNCRQKKITKSKAFCMPPKSDKSLSSHPTGVVKSNYRSRLEEVGFQRQEAKKQALNGVPSGD